MYLHTLSLHALSRNKSEEKYRSPRNQFTNSNLFPPFWSNDNIHTPPRFIPSKERFQGKNFRILRTTEQSSKQSSIADSQKSIAICKYLLTSRSRYSSPVYFERVSLVNFFVSPGCPSIGSKLARRATLPGKTDSLLGLQPLPKKLDKVLSSLAFHEFFAHFSLYPFNDRDIDKFPLFLSSCFSFSKTTLDSVIELILILDKLEIER